MPTNIQNCVLWELGEKSCFSELFFLTDPVMVTCALCCRILPTLRLKCLAAKLSRSPASVRSLQTCFLTSSSRRSFSFRYIISHSFSFIFLNNTAKLQADLYCFYINFKNKAAPSVLLKSLKKLNIIPHVFLILIDCQKNNMNAESLIIMLNKQN